MLSFFDMCDLLDNAKQKLFEAGLGDRLKKKGFNTTNAPTTGVTEPVVNQSAEVEPTKSDVQATYSKENPHPDAGKISYRGFRVPTGEVDAQGNPVMRDASDEELEKHKARREKDLASRIPGKKTATQQDNERAVKLKDWQDKWSAFQEKVKGLLARRKKPATIARELEGDVAALNAIAPDSASIYDNAIDAVNDALPLDIKPDLGDENAEPVDVDQDALDQSLQSQEPGQGEVERQNIKSDYLADFINIFNQWLASPGWRGVTAHVGNQMNLKDKNGRPIRFPTERTPTGEMDKNGKPIMRDKTFDLASNVSRGADRIHKDRDLEIVIGAKDLAKLIREVHKIMGVQMGQKPTELNASLGETLAMGFSKDPSMGPTIIRAMEFEKHIPDFYGDELTLGELADEMANKSGGKTLAGGLGANNNDEDVKAVSYLIRTSESTFRMKDEEVGGTWRGRAARLRARKHSGVLRKPEGEDYGVFDQEPEKAQKYKRKFNFFSWDKKSDPNLENPDTVIKVNDPHAQTDEIDEVPTDLAGRVGSKSAQLAARLRGLRKKMENPLIPPNESTDYVDLMDLMEYWDK